MSQLANLPPISGSIDLCEWIDTGNMSELVAKFARVHMLVTLFDGDPDKWLQFLTAQGTPEEISKDLPFIQEVKRRLAAEPFFVQDLRRCLREFSTLLAASVKA